MILVGPKLDDDDIIRAGGGTIAAVASGRDNPGADTITTDEEARAALKVQHLVELGHTDIVHIDGAANISSRPVARL